mmetsp:Transcript_61284/g.150806  ORF Transcript_61284/g.150806 Transcript_61284/m.150806 type:complete len:278 (-) Transcript_61284:400-1233(-)
MITRLFRVPLLMLICDAHISPRLEPISLVAVLPVEHVHIASPLLRDACHVPRAVAVLGRHALAHFELRHVDDRLPLGHGRPDLGNELEPVQCVLVGPVEGVPAFFIRHGSDGALVPAAVLVVAIHELPYLKRIGLGEGHRLRLDLRLGPDAALPSRLARPNLLLRLDLVFCVAVVPVNHVLAILEDLGDLSVVPTAVGVVPPHRVPLLEVGHIVALDLALWVVDADSLLEGCTLFGVAYVVVTKIEKPEHFVVLPQHIKQRIAPHRPKLVPCKLDPL